MNLNDINLTAQQLADLFGNTLLDTKSIDMPKKESLPFLGNNKKNIVVLVANTNAPFLPDNELSFLMNVLGACQLTIADVAIINMQKTNINYETIVENFDSKTVLLFNVEPLSIDLPLNFPQFQIQQFNGITFIHAPALNEIENDKELKKKLWISLKKIFAI